MVDRALGYYFYTGAISHTISGTRYPISGSMLPVESGKVYTVTAYNVGEGGARAIPPTRSTKWQWRLPVP